MDPEVLTEPRSLPSVSELLEELGEERAPHDLLVASVRRALSEARARLAEGGVVHRAELVESARRELAAALAPWPRRAINATGVVLHTNLGRAPLSEDAVRAMREATSYCDLELDLESGERGQRDSHVSELLARLVGAEAATVVNNNAGALVLALSALARGREVIVSRGQAVEIGGRFRIPEVLEQSGAVLRDVGTTNRTYASDYEAACNERTALLLRVHHSNFHLEGFVADVGVEELVEVARPHGLRVLNDLGSGCLVDTASLGLPHEPTVQESVAAGADLTVFSGDKLLGGPQAGLIVGREDAVRALRRHPLARALRCDKVTLAGLHATLLHYLEGEATEKIPALRMLARRPEELEAEARSWLERLHLPGASVERASSAVGGGALPQARIPTWCLVLDPSRLGWSADELARRLRTGKVPIVSRVEGDRVWLDPRTIQPEEEADLLAGLRTAIQQ